MLLVVTGGSRSGKSRAAQKLAERGADGREVLVAVFGRTSGDEEMARRVTAHRESRPEHFVTLEVDSVSALSGDARDAEVLLVDCLGTALGLCMEECWPQGAEASLAQAGPDDLPAGYEDRVREIFSEVIDGIVARQGDTVVVTNEVGSGLVSTWASGRLFADVLGDANRRLVAAADAAYLAVCGRMIDLKAFEESPGWPTD